MLGSKEVCVRMCTYEFNQTTTDRTTIDNQRNANYNVYDRRNE